MMKQAQQAQAKMAEMQKEAIGEEAGRMEDMPAWKARVLGVSKQDVI